MKRPKGEGRISRMVMMALSVFALTACSLFKPVPAPVVLRGNTIQAIYSTSSAGKKVLSSYRIGPEALARLLEKAQACKQP